MSAAAPPPPPEAPPPPPGSPPPPHKATWAVFVALLLLATLFVAGTSAQMPPFVASHFDAAGEPTSFMSRAGYLRFILCLAIGLPMLIVTCLTIGYSRARTLKLPNREYWLAPERLARTRSFLVAHGVWFGSLFVILICFMHWLELGANRLHPPHLSNQAFGVGMLIFLIAMAAWIATLMLAFRRPRQ